MSGVAAAIAGSAIISAGVGIYESNQQSNAAQNAAQMQHESADEATQVQQQEFNQVQQNQAPWLAAGGNALSQLQNPNTTRAFNESDFQQDPGYQFNLQQGQLALQRSAAAQGGLQNTGTLKNLAAYSQGMASNEYQNAFNRYMSNQQANVNRLQSLAGLGMQSNGLLTGAGAQNAQTIGNIAMSNGNAQAASEIAQGNAAAGAAGSIGNAISGGLNNWAGYTMANRSGGLGGLGYGGNSYGQIMNSDYTNSNYTMPEMGSELSTSSGPSLGLGALGQ